MCRDEMKRVSNLETIRQRPSALVATNLKMVRKGREIGGPRGTREK